MADVAAEGEFDLVYVVFNTFFAMLTQEDQVRCFANVAGRLKPDGAFVIQAFVPDLSRFDRDQRVQATDVDMTRSRSTRASTTRSRRRVTTQKLVVSDGAVSMLPTASATRGRPSST